MVSLYRDPEGEFVFASGSQGTTNAITGTLDREGPDTEMLRTRVKELERVIDDYKVCMQLQEMCVCGVPSLSDCMCSRLWNQVNTLSVM